MRSPGPFLNISFVVTRVGLILLGILTLVTAGITFALVVGLSPLPTDAGLNSALVVPMMAIATLVLAVSALTLWQLDRMLRDARAGAIFTDRNVRRLRTLAWLVIAYQPVIVAQQWIAMRMEGKGLLDGVFQYSLSGLLAALLCFALAEVFAHGVALQEDAEGTV